MLQKLRKMKILLLIISSRIIKALPPRSDRIKQFEPIVPEILNLEELAVKSSFEANTPEKDSLVWENTLRFDNQLESGLKFVRELLDPFHLRERLERFEEDIQKLIILTMLGITIVYNVFVFVFTGIFLVKFMTLVLYLVTKAIKLLGQIISVFTNCFVCSKRQFCFKKKSMALPIQP